MNAQEQRRLLELAAKAAGYKVYGDGKLFRIWKDSNVEWVDWNPLTDDGDSRRLQVALRIKHERHPIHPFVAAWAPEISARFEEPEGDDPYAATRLAIVRAAAAIGEKMEAKP